MLLVHTMAGKTQILLTLDFVPRFWQLTDRDTITVYLFIDPYNRM